MGTEHTLTLYTAQTNTVLEVLRRDGVCWSREEYVARKYGESAPVFLTAYRWFASAAQALVPKPTEAGPVQRGLLRRKHSGPPRPGGGGGALRPLRLE